MSFKYDRLKEAELKAIKNRNSNFTKENEGNRFYPKKEVASNKINFKLNIFFICLLVVILFAIAIICKFMNNKITTPVNSKIIQQSDKVISSKEKSVVNELKKKYIKIFEEDKQTLKIESNEIINWQQIDAQTVKINFNPQMDVMLPDFKNNDYQFVNTDNQIIIKVQGQRNIYKILIDSPYKLRILIVNNTGSMEKILIPLTKEEKCLLESQKIAALLNDQKVEEAITALYQFVTEYPNEKEAREELVELLLKKGNLLKASHILDEGLKIFPEDLNLNKLKIQWYLIKGEKMSALHHLKKLSKHEDCDQEILALLASIAYQSGEYELAEKNYRFLLEQDMNNLAWWIGLGLSLDMQGKEKAAKEVYQKIDCEKLDDEIKEFINSRLGR